MGLSQWSQFRPERLFLPPPQKNAVSSFVAKQYGTTQTKKHVIQFVPNRSVILYLIKLRWTDKMHCENMCEVVTYFTSHRTTVLWI
jgi:hypothetical protein